MFPKSSSYLKVEENQLITKLKEFVKIFVIIYETSLSEYRNRLDNRVRKPGKYSDCITNVMKKCEKGFEDLGDAPLSIISNVVESAISQTGATHNRRQLKKLIPFLDQFKQEPTEVRVKLIKSSIEIFQCFEYQFVQAIADNSWQRAMRKLATDAVDRVIGYCKKQDSRTQFSTDLITKGVLLGESKIYRHNIWKFQPGCTINKPNSSISWNTTELFEKTGLVINNTKYFKKKDGTSDTNIYGYRRLFQWESKERIQDNYIEEQNCGEKYKYQLEDKQKEELSKIILDELKEENITLESIQEFLIEIRQQIKEDVDKYLDVMMKELKNFLQLVQEKFIKLEEKIDKIAIKPKLSVWFEVKDSLPLFTGRRQKLQQLDETLAKGITKIVGLPGVGKSELAIKYAREKFSENDNVIWINATTFSTAEQSFNKLYKQLKLKNQKNDSEEEGKQLIIEEIYRYFAGKRTLFIFDDVDQYILIKQFLPLNLPSVQKPYVLITSSNFKWNSDLRTSIEIVKLNDFDDVESMEFVKNCLNLKNDLQDEWVKKLSEKLHNFPLALQQAVAYIKEEDEIMKNINQRFTIKDYLKVFNEKAKNLLNSQILQESHDYNKTTFTAFQLILDKIKQNEDLGEIASYVINITAYFSSDNIPIKIFSLLLNDDRKLGAVIQLLKQYAILREKDDCKNMHGLLQEVIRWDLKEKEMEVNILKLGLELCEIYISESEESIEDNSAPSIAYIWNFVIKYEKLVETSIKNNIEKDKYKHYFNLIVKNSTYEVVEILIKKIEDMYPMKLRPIINSKIKRKNMSLHNAVLNGDVRIVQLLIKKGAAVNIKSFNQFTPLHLATKNGHLDIIQILLKHQININARTKYHFTPLHLAARNGYSEILDFLLSNGADINAPDKNQFTPLHHAVKSNNLDVVKALLKQENQININAFTDFKVTSLHFAAKEGFFDILQLLLEKGADTTIQDEGKFTPLHLAAINNHWEIVDAILSKCKATINLQTSHGKTPLHLATEKGHLKVAQILILNKADISLKCKQNKTVLDLAIENNYAEILNYIQMQP